jgi:GNAT superfamily N-acetyltransferase
MSAAGSLLATGLRIRAAREEDAPAIEALIAASARHLSRGFYSDAETEAAITHVFGLDSELVRDGTYFVVERASALVGCGGWSKRRTLFGGDRFAARESGLLDPAVDAARIRAFFIAPDQARQGIGAALLDTCEGAAIAAGFTRAALMATLPGVPFYAAQGYRPGPPIEHPCGDMAVRFVPMEKSLVA